jgi:hypothetical protein
MKLRFMILFVVQKLKLISFLVFLAYLYPVDIFLQKKAQKIKTPGVWKLRMS